jgi:hypothetical protein
MSNLSNLYLIILVVLLVLIIGISIPTRVWAARLIRK